MRARRRTGCAGCRRTAGSDPPRSPAPSRRRSRSRSARRPIPARARDGSARSRPSVPSCRASARASSRSSRLLLLLLELLGAAVPGLLGRPVAPHSGGRRTSRSAKNATATASTTTAMPMRIGSVARGDAIARLNGESIQWVGRDRVQPRGLGQARRGEHEPSQTAQAGALDEHPRPVPPVPGARRLPNPARRSGDRPDVSARPASTRRSRGHAALPLVRPSRARRVPPPLRDRRATAGRRRRSCRSTRDRPGRPRRPDGRDSRGPLLPAGRSLRNRSARRTRGRVFRRALPRTRTRRWG